MIDMNKLKNDKLKEHKRLQQKEIDTFANLIQGCVNRMCVTQDPKDLREKHAHAVMYLYQLLYMLHTRLQEDGHDNEQG